MERGDEPLLSRKTVAMKLKKGILTYMAEGDNIPPQQVLLKKNSLAW